MSVNARATVALVLVMTLGAIPLRGDSPVQQAADQKERVNERGAATKAFLDRLEEYVTFHNNVQKTVKALHETASPEDIAKREDALGAALIKARPNAKEGDFFIEPIRPYIKDVIRKDFARRSATDRKAVMVEVPKDFKIAVNTRYPTTLPLATFPANLLAALPELPKELEYRIVGRHLILRDVKGNVIVDIMRDVFPTPGRS